MYDHRWAKLRSAASLLRNTVALEPRPPVQEITSGTKGVCSTPQIY